MYLLSFVLWRILYIEWIKQAFFWVLGWKIQLDSCHIVSSYYRNLYSSCFGSFRIVGILRLSLDTGSGISKTPMTWDPGWLKAVDSYDQTILSLTKKMPFAKGKPTPDDMKHERCEFVSLDTSRIQLYSKVDIGIF